MNDPQPRLDAQPVEMAFDVVAVGASAGGLPTIRRLVEGLPPEFPLPVVAMLHLPLGAEPEAVLQRLPLPVGRLRHGQPLAAGTLWVCPPRAFVELLPDGSCLVSDNPQGALARPIDRLLGSAARSFGPRAIGVILTGMGADGALGAKALSVDEAKRALGERGPVWWNDGAPDYNRRMVRNTPYAGWFSSLESVARDDA